MNGFSWSRSGPRHLLAPARSSVRIGDPIRPLPQLRPFQDAAHREARKSFCRVTDPRGTSACPQSSPRSPVSLSKHGAASGEVRLRSQNRPLPVAPPRQGDRCCRAPSCPRGHALTRPSRSPPSSSTPTPSSSSDDLRGWVVPSVSSSDPGLAARCLSPPTPEGAGAPPSFPTGEPIGRRLFHTRFPSPVTGSSFPECSVQRAALPFPQRLDSFCDWQARDCVLRELPSAIMLAERLSARTKCASNHLFSSTIDPQTTHSPGTPLFHGISTGCPQPYTVGVRGR